MVFRLEPADPRDLGDSGDAGELRSNDRVLQRSKFAEIETAYHTLTPLLGAGAASLFLLSLIASGISSSVVGTIAGQPGVRTFDDTLTWWYDADEHAATGEHAGRYQPGWYSVDPPKTGTTISVLSAKGSTMTVKVAPK